MNDITYNSDNNSPSFEDFKKENGMFYWWASDLMAMLGYPNMKSFQKVLDRATKAFVSLNIPHYSNIIAEQRIIDGNTLQDFRLTRFACYITAMNGDPKKEEVAKAQSYFIQQSRKFELLIQNSEQIDRVIIREDIIEGNKSLSSIAKSSGVEDYAKFTNAGYLGMYNMYNWQLAKKRRIEKGKLTEYMGRAELAANLFRITMTEERIKSKGIKGQKNLEQTHYQVGNEIRDIVKESTGVTPENLPTEKLLPEVKKNLKIGYKKMISEDKPKKKKNNLR
jgi:DNA-damage-inducible protein D